MQTDHRIYPIAPLFCRVMTLHLPDPADAPTVKKDSRWLSFLFGDDMPRCRVIFIQHGSRICAGWRLTPYPAYVRPVVNLFTILAETAGAGGLNIAETFPEGRGSPHGCGLRAVFCTDAASARPEACRDKSKVPRSGDFAGRSPGVQGAAATGRPLCAPSAIRDITQKTNRERKLC